MDEMSYEEKQLARYEKIFATCKEITYEIEFFIKDKATWYRVWFDIDGTEEPTVFIEANVKITLPYKSKDGVKVVYKYLWWRW